MSKQGPAETCPQQLILDLESPKSAGGTIEAAPRVVAFIDSATRSVRQQALERVKSAGIFHLPQTR